MLKVVFIATIGKLILIFKTILSLSKLKVENFRIKNFLENEK